MSGDECRDRARCGEEGGGLTVAVSSKLTSAMVRNREGMERPSREG
jgi:hypothetical protein